LKKKIEWQDGNVIPSKEPGLGVELDEAVCEAHPYDGKALHLQMTQDPLFP
jgi:galactonate dehydratase